MILYDIDCMEHCSPLGAIYYKLGSSVKTIPDR